MGTRGWGSLGPTPLAFSPARAHPARRVNFGPPSARTDPARLPPESRHWGRRPGSLHLSGMLLPCPAALCGARSRAPGQGGALAAPPVVAGWSGWGTPLSPTRLPLQPLREGLGQEARGAARAAPARGLAWPPYLRCGRLSGCPPSLRTRRPRTRRPSETAMLMLRRPRRRGGGGAGRACARGGGGEGGGREGGGSEITSPPPAPPRSAPRPGGTRRPRPAQAGEPR